MLFGSASAPSRYELGWTSFADIIGILSAIFGGMFTLLAYAPPSEPRLCGTVKCDDYRAYLAGPAQAMAVWLIFAVACVPFSSYLCISLFLPFFSFYLFLKDITCIGFFSFSKTTTDNWQMINLFFVDQ